ncbi:glycosyltransferase family 2 protein [Caenimonas sedimenti]|uniref:Glycosyltransferase family 2 protein n=1 Tax=Caenimonas sedimenti TaxID=2596921 RepID=A0A562ZPC4_9BURK|nr:glycosyltransferase family 2 protein [Caenimonas sedimenti]TWO70014.1 glycosyltransferase family 2 protein [Caenimonas sedimenti]
MRGLSSESAGPPETRSELSAIVITRNEEANIAACLASLAFAGEVIVVDNASTDRTVEIARAAGAQVHHTPDWPGFGPQKNRALALATRPWVLSIDADERVTPTLRDEILAVVQARTTAADAWDLPRRSSYCGQYMAHSGWYPDRVTRLFRRGTARFSDDLVHERLLPTGSIGHLRHDLLHESIPSLESALQKMDRYSTAGAERMLAEGRRGSPGKAVAHGLWAFLRTFVLQRGFLDGRMGFALAVSNAEGTYYRYLKLWLLQRRAGNAP